MGEPTLKDNQSQVTIHGRGDVEIKGDVVGRDKHDHSLSVGKIENAPSVAIGEGARAETHINLWVPGAWLVIGLLGAGLLVIALLAVVNFGSQPTPNPCQAGDATFDFESQTTEGWAIRDEGSNSLGVSLRPDSAHGCSPSSAALAFQMNLRTAPFDKAQVKYETAELRPPQLLSGYVYVPAGAPGDLQASCFALEDNQNLAQTQKPPWPWYQSGPTPLTAGHWNFIQCGSTDFIPLNTAGSLARPLLVGFEFRSGAGESYLGTLYLDKITLK